MNNKIKQFIVFGVSSLLALSICLGVLVVTVKNLGTDESATENKVIVNKTELSSSEKTLSEYINRIVSETDNRFVKTKTYTDVSVANLKSLNYCETQSQDEALLNFAKDKMLPAIDGFYDEDFQGVFEKNDSKKIFFTINKALLQGASYSIGQTNEAGEQVLDDEGNLVDNEYYYLTYVIDVENKAFDQKLSDMLSVKNDLAAKKQFVDAVKSDCKINELKSKLDSVTIKAKVNRESDDIQYINVIRNYSVTLDVEFINAAELFGGSEFSFDYTVTDTYEYSYAGISFVEDEVIVDVNEEYLLNVNAVIDDDSEYTVEFVSSDEAIATIDEMGYVKLHKSCDVPVTITVKLSYLGEAFTDTCTVTASEE